MCCVFAVLSMLGGAVVQRALAGGMAIAAAVFSTPESLVYSPTAGISTRRHEDIKEMHAPQWARAPRSSPYPPICFRSSPLPFRVFRFFISSKQWLTRSLQDLRPEKS